MPIDTYISLVTAAAWAALTDEQRSDWHFWGEDNPITTQRGDYVTLNGWMAFNSCNSLLALAGYTPLIEDPPADLTPPAPTHLTATIWTIKHKAAAGATDRSPRLILIVDPPIADDVVVIVTQARTPRWNAAGYWHNVTNTLALLPGASGTMLLTGNRSTEAGGDPDRTDAMIRGTWKHSRRGTSIARTVTANVSNGQRATGDVRTA